MARKEPLEPYYRIDTSEAKEMLDSGSGAVVIDVRRPDEWAAGHVQGAIHIPVDDIMTRIEELPTETNLLLICAQGVRSGLACEFASAMGYSSDRLFNIEDGTAPWIEKGYPTEQG